jgi:4-hydroxy-2-oxoglutarate aldolase
VVLGSNGEYVYLSEQEKIACVETAARAAGEEMVIIAGTGCESTAATIRLTEQCAEAGAHAALIVTPHYYGGRMTPEALSLHFQTVAERSPVPVLLYHVPKFTHINLAADTVAELSQHPSIIGIKDSSANLSFLGELMGKVHEDFGILVGTAAVLFSGLTLGCVGAVLALANIAPRECGDSQKHIDAGNLEAARRLQLRMIPVNQAVTAIYGIPGLKAALDLIGYFGGEPRRPLLPPTGADLKKIESILKAGGLLA